MSEAEQENIGDLGNRKAIPSQSRRSRLSLWRNNLP